MWSGSNEVLIIKLRYFGSLNSVIYKAEIKSTTKRGLQLLFFENSKLFWPLKYSEYKIQPKPLSTAYQHTTLLSDYAKNPQTCTLW